MIADACCILKTWENKRRVKTSKYATVSNSLIFLISCELRSFCVNLTMRALHCLYRACLESTRISRGWTLPEERARFVYSFSTCFINTGEAPRVDGKTVDFQKVLRRISYGAGRDFVARGRPFRGQKRLAPLAKRSTCSKSRKTGATVDCV